MSPELAEYVYVDTAWGALNRRNHVRRLSDLDFKDGGAERYISHRRATVELLDWTHSHTNASGQPTIEGFDGPVWDPSLPFDFDDRQDPAHALDWLRQFLERLERQDVPLDALRIYFSGAKGFHLEIPHTLFGGFEPSDQLHVWEKAAAVELLHGIPFDSAVYDKLRLWRVVNTLNAKGHHYKVRLSLEEVRGLSMAEILALAEAPRGRIVTAADEDWQPNDYLVEVWARARNRQVATSASLEPGPLKAYLETTWSDTRRQTLTAAVLAAAIAASWPVDPTISRHSDYLLPLSGFLARHMDAAAVAELLKEAARQSGDRSFLDDRTRHWEAEIDRLAEGSAAKIEAGEQVEGLPTLAQRFPELVEVVSAQFVVPISPKKPSKNGTDHGLSFTAVRDVIAEPREETAFLVDGMLPMGGISLWGAKPKVGKSVATRNLARCVARGEPFLERACVQGTVLMLSLEEKRAEVANHLRDMGIENEPIHLHTGAAPETSKEGIAALAAAIAVYQPVLVIVDPVFKLVRVRDSSDYAELTKALEPVIELSRNSGCHIAVTHHLGKMVREGGDDVLGSTAIFGAVDTLVIMRRRQDNLRVLHTMQRYGKDLPETTIPLDEFTGCIGLGSAVQEIKLLEARKAVLELLAANDGLERETIRKEAGVASQLAQQALMALVKEDLVVRTGAGKAGQPYLYHVAPTASEKGGFWFSPYIEKTRNHPKQTEEEGVCLGCGKPRSEDLIAVGLHPGCSLEDPE